MIEGPQGQMGIEESISCTGDHLMPRPFTVFHINCLDPERQRVGVTELKTDDEPHELYKYQTIVDAGNVIRDQIIQADFNDVYSIDSFLMNIAQYLVQITSKQREIEINKVHAAVELFIFLSKNPFTPANSHSICWLLGVLLELPFTNREELMPVIFSDNRDGRVNYLIQQMIGNLTTNSNSEAIEILKIMSDFLEDGTEFQILGAILAVGFFDYSNLDISNYHVSIAKAIDFLLNEIFSFPIFYRQYEACIKTLITLYPESINSGFMACQYFIENYEKNSNEEACDQNFLRSVKLDYLNKLIRLLPFMGIEQTSKALSFIIDYMQNTVATDLMPDFSDLFYNIAQKGISEEAKSCIESYFNEVKVMSGKGLVNSETISCISLAAQMLMLSNDVEDNTKVIIEFALRPKVPDPIVAQIIKCITVAASSEMLCEYLSELILPKLVEIYIQEFENGTIEEAPKPNSKKNQKIILQALQLIICKEGLDLGEYQNCIEIIFNYYLPKNFLYAKYVLKEILKNIYHEETLELHQNVIEQLSSYVSIEDIPYEMCGSILGVANSTKSLFISDFNQVGILVYKANEAATNNNFDAFKTIITFIRNSLKLEADCSDQLAEFKEEFPNSICIFEGEITYENMNIMKGPILMSAFWAIKYYICKEDFGFFEFEDLKNWISIDLDQLYNITSFAIGLIGKIEPANFLVFTQNMLEFTIETENSDSFACVSKILTMLVYGSFGVKEAARKRITNRVEEGIFQEADWPILEVDADEQEMVRQLVEYLMEYVCEMESLGSDLNLIQWVGRVIEEMIYWGEETILPKVIEIIVKFSVEDLSTVINSVIRSIGSRKLSINGYKYLIEMVSFIMCRAIEDDEISPLTVSSCANLANYVARASNFMVEFEELFPNCITLFNEGKYQKSSMVELALTIAATKFQIGSIVENLPVIAQMKEVAYEMAIQKEIDYELVGECINAIKEKLRCGISRR